MIRSLVDTNYPFNTGVPMFKDLHSPLEFLVLLIRHVLKCMAQVWSTGCWRCISLVSFATRVELELGS